MEKEIEQPKETVLSSKHVSRLYIAGAAGLLAGLLLMVAFRFFVTPEPVHYHANFAVFINGERQSFESQLYYEEVQSCSADAIGPRTRIHLHQPENNVIHVHDDGATWGNLFENIGWGLGNNYLSDGLNVLTKTENNNLVFVLNGQPTKDVANRIVGDEDRLLISYGPEDTDRNAQFEQVENSAPVFNEQKDPAACQGSDEEDFLGRLRRAILG